VEKGSKAKMVYVTKNKISDFPVLILQLLKRLRENL
jgi:hypothetical protein